MTDLRIHRMFKRHLAAMTEVRPDPDSRPPYDTDPIEALEALLTEGVCANGIDEKDGSTPLHLACWIQLPEAIEILIRDGAQVNAIDSKGKTPLHYAVLDQNYDLITPLIQAGAEIDPLDQDGRTPLLRFLLGVEFSYPFRDGRLKPAITLLRAGADPLRPSNNGSTSMTILEDLVRDIGAKDASPLTSRVLDGSRSSSEQLDEVMEVMREKINQRLDVAVEHGDILG